MRAVLIALLAAGLGAPALSQPLTGVSPGLQSQMDLQLRLNELQARQDLAAPHAVDQQNQLMNLEAQLRAEQAYSTVRQQSATPRLPPPPQSGPMPQIDTGQLASIPDDRLAASNARVKAAADNRR